MQRKSGGVVGLLGVLKLNKKQFMEARTVFSTHICVVVMQRVKSGSRVKLRYKGSWTQSRIRGLRSRLFQATQPRSQGLSSSRHSLGREKERPWERGYRLHT